MYVHRYLSCKGIMWYLRKSFDACLRSKSLHLGSGRARGGGLRGEGFKISAAILCPFSQLREVVFPIRITTLVCTICLSKGWVARAPFFHRRCWDFPRVGPATTEVLCRELGVSPFRACKQNGRKQPPEEGRIWQERNWKGVPCKPSFQNGSRGNAFGGLLRYLCMRPSMQ